MMSLYAQATYQGTSVEYTQGFGLKNPGPNIMYKKASCNDAKGHRRIEYIEGYALDLPPQIQYLPIQILSLISQSKLLILPNLFPLPIPCFLFSPICIHMQFQDKSKLPKPQTVIQCQPQTKLHAIPNN